MRELTKAQRELLAEVVGGEHHCSDTYRPAQQLVAKGYCVWKEGKYSKLILATEEGRAILRAAEEGAG